MNKSITIMNILTKKDILNMLKAVLREDVSIATPDKKYVLIVPGYKIEHIKSGLLYTVKQVDKKNDKFYITAKSGDGNVIVIDQKEFKQYGGA